MNTDKVNKFEQGKITLADEALEDQLKEIKEKKVNTTFNGYLMLLFGILLTISPAVSGRINDGLERRLFVTVGAIISFWGVLAIITGLIKYKEDYSEYENRLKQLMQNEKVGADINRELVKLAPLVEDMLKAISKKYPETGKKLLENKLSEQDATQIADFMRKYLKEHPNNANQFVNLLTVTQAPQDLIDKFVAEYVPGTITFNMARNLAMKGKGNEKNE
jgi:hypothetical protein